MSNGRIEPDAKLVSESELDTRFTYHKPQVGQGMRFQNIRDGAKKLAYLINSQCPDCREKSLALTKLEEMVMWANAAIARREGVAP